MLMSAGSVVPPGIAPSDPLGRHVTACLLQLIAPTARGAQEAEGSMQRGTVRSGEQVDVEE
eukprot:13159880-Alexandrium_andersonii.AAC.1